ncbi:MAG: co-chaperone GroES, partial [Abditibacteriota bacterium]|nr:co-chaperone GroES [Abditibacteriota bacterium]
LQGTVVAVGEGVQLNSGKIIAPDVKVGDVVVYGKYAGTEVKVDGVDYVIVRSDDVLAVLE